MAAPKKSKGIKRKLEDKLDKLPSATPLEVPRRQVQATDKWSDLYQEAARNPAIVFEHAYRRQATINGAAKDETVDIAHTHGEFINTVRAKKAKFELEKLNISTKRVDGAARTHEKLFDVTGAGMTGVTNIMRVIKGTHTGTGKGLVGTQEEARGAVEFGAEIGISEFARGGGVAVLHAMESLYLLKHGVITRAQFLKPDSGFQGAGEGGAARLRALEADRAKALAFHETNLQNHFQNYVRSKRQNQNKKDIGFEMWRDQKITKWTRRV